MKGGTIKETLKNFGLSEKQAEIYIFLGKRGPLKGGEITKRLKMNKGQVYRILRKLEKKGLVEETLEFPTRFTAAPLESVIDSFVKAKQEEVAEMEEAKKDLLTVWNKISQKNLESQLEKFSVIEGHKRIFHKISQMVNSTTNKLSMVLLVTDLRKAEQFEVFNAIYEKLVKSKIQVRTITKVSKQNANNIKVLSKQLKPVIDFRGKNPSLGSPTFNRMVIRDTEEIILFISDMSKDSFKDKKEVCLYTNCKSIIKSYLGIFEDVWKYSTNIKDTISEIETGKQTPNTSIVKEAKEAFRKYHDTFFSVEKELLMITSPKGLVKCGKGLEEFRKLVKRGVSVKIMAPIIGENLKATKQLLEICEVRHIPAGYLGITIIDGKHLFQFKKYPAEDSEIIDSFENMLYSNDSDYVERAKNMLNNIWRNAFAPSTITLNAITRIDEFDHTSFGDKEMTSELKKIKGLDSKDVNLPTSYSKKVLLNKFINAKRIRVKDMLKEPVTFYCTAGQAVIHPPSDFRLPDMLFHIFHLNKKSCFGTEDAMIVTCRQAVPTGYAYVPGAFITDNSEGIDFWKKTFAGLPFDQKLVQKDEFFVQVQGNTLFAGWTVPIPLALTKKILPPSCIMIEGYGNVKTGKYSIKEPSGDAIINEVNYFEGFVTYMHPSSKYTGPGTDGYFFREFLSTTYPPSSK